MGEVCRRLPQAGALTRTGRTVWERRVVWGLLKQSGLARHRGVWHDTSGATAAPAARPAHPARAAAAGRLGP